MLRGFALFLLVFSAPSSVLAVVTVDIFQGKAVMVEENGLSVERVEPVETVVPGDVIVYRYTVHNDAAKPAADVNVVATVPQFMTYSENSAAIDGWTMTVSNDGENHAPEGELVIYEIDETSRPAKASDIRYLRWVLQGEIAPYARQTLEFRAQLNR